jgi:hypothetical protein
MKDWEDAGAVRDEGDGGLGGDGVVQEEDIVGVASAESGEVQDSGCAVGGAAIDAVNAESLLFRDTFPGSCGFSGYEVDVHLGGAEDVGESKEEDLHAAAMEGVGDESGADGCGHERVLRASRCRPTKTGGERGDPRTEAFALVFGDENTDDK